jgi:hypothetical protein
MKVKGTALLAGAAAGLIALTLTSTPSDARWGGGWRGGGWRGAAWRGGWGPGWRGGWRYGGWRRPGLALGAAAVGLGVGLAASSAWGYPGYGYGYGYGYPGYYGAYSGCLRQVWYAGAWRLVNVC